jgi:hypothetical protein
VSGKKLKLKNAQAQSDVDGAFTAAAIPPQGFAIVIV